MALHSLHSLHSLQDILMRLALQMVGDEYKDRRERRRQGVALARDAGRNTGRKPNTKIHERIIALRKSGHSTPEATRLAGCSANRVKRVWALSQHPADLNVRQIQRAGRAVFGPETCRA